MSKKHFKAFAAAIAGITEDSERLNAAFLIGRVCAEHNPRFDWQTWYAACGVKQTQAA